ncbi:dihydrofolate reductase family protein [Paeniglutamicibacter kerguelensis]|uniref:Dihydrofolate reductase n=1 Tax=Paeniglutamicibacter kerguelensis TaxID=254788 RepID=A0ABS4XDU3_9MICC|nr:dihydrofolate reductase family protein [Paeniglutamicibacter kerguelensis]MBP2386456.1 dihydrofolate reductase [Paeniglutamicibacter kerguelensis]
MLIYSMGVSVDGFITDREGGFGWTDPNEEQFRFHIAQVGELGGYLCGRRLYETMLVWETDPTMRNSELGAIFADIWCALPKVVFSRTLDTVQGNARLAEAPLAEEVAVVLGATDRDVALGGANLAAAAIGLGLVDELRIFRNPVSSAAARPSCRLSPKPFGWTSSRSRRSARAWSSSATGAPVMGRTDTAVRHTKKRPSGFLTGGPPGSRNAFSRRAGRPRTGRSPGR